MHPHTMKADEICTIVCRKRVQIIRKRQTGWKMNTLLTPHALMTCVNSVRIFETVLSNLDLHLSMVVSQHS